MEQHNESNVELDQNFDILPIESIMVALKVKESQIRKHIDKERYSLADLMKLREIFNVPL